MKILERAKKKTESIRFDDGVGAGIPTSSERGGARLQTLLYGI